MRSLLTASALVLPESVVPAVSGGLLEDAWLLIEDGTIHSLAPAATASHNTASITTCRARCLHRPCSTSTCTAQPATM